MCLSGRMRMYWGTLLPVSDVRASMRNCVWVEGGTSSSPRLRGPILAFKLTMEATWGKATHEPAPVKRP